MNGDINSKYVSIAQLGQIIFTYRQEEDYQISPCPDVENLIANKILGWC